MKKAFLLILMVLLAVGITMAQTYTLGSGLTGIDKLGAHQNGGKGCVGCHAPHSGAFGEGGNAAQGGVVGDKTNAGNYALWGQDLGPLYGYHHAGRQGHGRRALYTELPAQAEFYNFPEEIPGIMMCLSCHDGNVATGAMMTNKSYEQAEQSSAQGRGWTESVGTERDPDPAWQRWNDSRQLL